ncbi:hypothetical protein GCM10018793_55100 [Streptomyces sulfonofaciens]|uniref:Xaa-Pro dipeptidyl-peptidase C-terminal domain-containing protein n=1 Tax=Streptomyces sulfonofaciens TaxID=68272 RepID=A0A919GJS1_9ACTN|nr:hypothetical protein GCM10018793_55100 [Streptomyces sulfonofaciens]
MKYLAYGPDAVELVADVTRSAQAEPPAPSTSPPRRPRGHRPPFGPGRRGGGAPVRVPGAKGAAALRRAGVPVPYTVREQTPGMPSGVDLELFSTAYDVPAGHRLALVVDTADPLCVEHDPSGAQLTFSSPRPTRRRGRSGRAKSDLRLPRRPCPAPPAFPLYRPSQTIRHVRALVGGHALTINNRICSLLSALPV